VVIDFTIFDQHKCQKNFQEKIKQYEKRQLVIKNKHKQLQNMWCYPAINTPAEGVVVFEGGVLFITEMTQFIKFKVLVKI
jgi:hypothetical protein